MNDVGDLVRAVQAAQLSGAALNTWLALTTSREWTVSAELGQSIFVTLRISIREGTGPILDTGDYILNAEALTG